MKANITQFTLAVTLSLAAIGASYAETGSQWVGESIGYQAHAASTAKTGQNTLDGHWVSEAAGYLVHVESVPKNTIPAIQTPITLKSNNTWIGEAVGQGD